MPRRVFALIIIEGTDHEWFSKNQYAREVYEIERTFDSNNPADDFNVPHVHWGDECRVEVDMTGRLEPSGNVKIEVEARFYEGTSIYTDELADRDTRNFSVPPGGRPVSREIHLHNREWGGGDSAKVKLVLTNSSVED